jgi:hypothetical protein
MDVLTPKYVHMLKIYVAGWKTGYSDETIDNHTYEFVSLTHELEVRTTQVNTLESVCSRQIRSLHSTISCRNTFKSRTSLAIHTQNSHCNATHYAPARFHVPQACKTLDVAIIRLAVGLLNSEASCELLSKCFFCC